MMAIRFAFALLLSWSVEATDCRGSSFERGGGYDPVFTPFHLNGSVNLGVIPAYAAWTTKAGTHTIILGGSTGEWPSMTSKERIDVLTAWRAAIDKLPASMSPRKTRVKIMFHAGDVCLDRAVGLAQQVSL